MGLKKLGVTTKYNSSKVKSLLILNGITRSLNLCSMWVVEKKKLTFSKCFWASRYSCKLSQIWTRLSPIGQVHNNNLEEIGIRIRT